MNVNIHTHRNHCGCMLMRIHHTDIEYSRHKETKILIQLQKLMISRNRWHATSATECFPKQPLSEVRASSRNDSSFISFEYVHQLVRTTRCYRFRVCAFSTLVYFSAFKTPRVIECISQWMIYRSENIPLSVIKGPGTM